MTGAREYHERTKHSMEELREQDFSLDEETKPRPYKRYEDLPRERLSSVRPPQAPALSVVAESRADPLAGTDQPPPGPPDRETLATLCHAAAGIVRVGEHEGEPIPFRAASCTGKLYHVDPYLVCGDCPGLPAGVYHFDPREFALDVLRRGDYRGVLAEATGGHAGVAAAPATFVVASTWWRNAWKYRERTYRHAFWDAGTVLANLLAAAAALDRRAEVVAGYADDPVADLLGVDPEEEAPLALVPVGRGRPAPDPRAVDTLDPATVPYSPRTIEYPLIHEAWRASALPDGETAGAWRERAGDWRAGASPTGAAASEATAAAAAADGTAAPDADGTAAAADGTAAPDAGGERVALDPVDHDTASARPLWNAIRRRRSCREFARRPLSRRKLGTVLDRALRPAPGDWNGGGRRSVDGAAGLAYNEVYVLATNVEGVSAGAYRYDPAGAALERVGPTTDGDKARLALGQEWAGDAHVNVYCTADVDAVVEDLGDRGYRLAQLEAGIALGRLYLATYAHRDLGGTGLTFLDDDVTEHLSPSAAGRTPTTLFAFGVAD